MERFGKIFFGLILILGFIFLAVSLLSPSSFYIPDRLQLDSEGNGINYCGKAGVHVSFLFLDIFGAGAFFLLLPLLDLIVSYWFSWREDSPCLSTIGAFLLLTGICGGSAIWEGDYSFGPVLAGAGGYYGELIRFYLTDAFAPLGVWFFLGALFLAGIVLYCPTRLIYGLLTVLGVYALADIIFRQIQKIQNCFFKRKKKYLENNIPDFSEFNGQNIGTDFREKSANQNSSGETVGDLESVTSAGDLPEGSDVAKDADIMEQSDSAASFGIGETDRNAESRAGTEAFQESISLQKVPFDSEGTDLAAESSEFEAENKNTFTSEGRNGVTDDGVRGMTAGQINQSNQANGENQEDFSEENLPADYQYPDIEYLKEESACDEEKIRSKIEHIAQELEKAFLDFGYEVHVVETHIGPVITMYEITLPRGTRLNKIQPLANDLQRALKSKVRIVAPLPDKDTVGVEIPNPDRQIVRLRNLIEESKDQVDKMALPIFLGKNVSGVPIVNDLAKLPHLLIAGRTGTGKSVCLNAIIMSLLMTRTPFQVKMILIDPKMVELILYKNIPHLMHPVVTDMKKAEAILAWTVQKMEDRYAILARSCVRNLEEYNHLDINELRLRIQPDSEEEWKAIPKSMPYIVVIADEMADLMMTSGKEVEQHIIRLAQKSRAVGIHLVLATQKPTVDVVTGLIKSNLPARIAFGVASRTDSQVVLDCTGAERLLGNGDMLLLTPGSSDVVRGQGTFVSEQEINSVTKSIGGGQQFEVILPDIEDEGGLQGGDLLGDERDALYDQIIEYLFQEGGGSVSSIQRKFRIGYPRAGRIFDCLETDGLVSKANPLKKSLPRDMLITYDEWKQRKEEEKSGANKNDEANKRYPLLDSTRQNSSFLPPTLGGAEKQPFYDPFKKDSASSGQRQYRETGKETEIRREPDHEADHETGRETVRQRDFIRPGFEEKVKNVSLPPAKDLPNEEEEEFEDYYVENAVDDRHGISDDAGVTVHSEENFDQTPEVDEESDEWEEEDIDESEDFDEDYIDESEEGADAEEEDIDESEDFDEDYIDESEEGANAEEEDIDESEDFDEDYIDESEEDADAEEEDINESEDFDEDYIDESEEGTDAEEEDIDESEDFDEDYIDESEEDADAEEEDIDESEDFDEDYIDESEEDADAEEEDIDESEDFDEDYIDESEEDADAEEEDIDESEERAAEKIISESKSASDDTFVTKESAGIAKDNDSLGIKESTIDDRREERYSDRENSEKRNSKTESRKKKHSNKKNRGNRNLENRDRNNRNSQNIRLVGGQRQDSQRQDSQGQGGWSDQKWEEYLNHADD